ncbi:hypothetical protein EUGRSUZ_I01151 [Eucalyptus grandis]|uniref:Uncharacterized protein n=2 Tax=Eucalyptus grandis TaxID=71139 RepID=A0ACC3JER0_EUCGR|nr:hypothetical protein EUGRSUZ_I01151 [Eucalyptus grandis]
MDNGVLYRQPSDHYPCVEDIHRRKMLVKEDAQILLKARETGKSASKMLVTTESYLIRQDCELNLRD